MHQTAKFKLSGQFRFSRHPWGPWGRLSSGVICISKIYQLFCDSGAALVDFFKLMKMLPNVSFISMVIKKVFLSVSIATISNFLQKCTLWRQNYETSQPKIGQCDSEKASKFCEVSTLVLSVCTVDKINMEISQNFVAFSEYTNFDMAVKICHPVEDPVNWSAKIWGVIWPPMAPTSLILLKLVARDIMCKLEIGKKKLSTNLQSI